MVNALYLYLVHLTTQSALHCMSAFSDSHTGASDYLREPVLQKKKREKKKKKHLK